MTELNGTATRRVEGLETIDGVEYYVVPEVDRLDPFLVGVVSPGDHWLYASSAGGLAAGRVNSEGSLFPYRTDDLLHRVHGFSGGWTGLRVDGTTWEPSTGRPTSEIDRCLARSVAGDRLLVEEIHEGLGLRMSVCWCFSEPSGILRRVELERIDDRSGDRRIEVMDGFRDLVAGGAGVAVMQSMSCLINAYTRAEVVGDRGLAVVAMESALSDRAEPAESLLATVAWGTGLAESTLVLDGAEAERFARGEEPRTADRVVGRSCGYLRHATLELHPGERIAWSTAADVRRSQSQVAALRDRLAAGGDLESELDAEVAETSAAMDVISAETDGLQCSGDRIADAHHRTNTLYNDMRGGIPFDRETLPWGDWASFCRLRNRTIAGRHEAWLDHRGTTEIVDRRVLLGEAAATGDPDLQRLSLEYLPFWFGRRHGDPSRPWNRFNIRIRNEEGERLLSYEGNWRDIFQNWEALALAHPGWLDQIIAKFVNATTPDGYNAYRITREGIDWEMPEPDNPWSNLGYWGDHQIVYLTRLLEASLATSPEGLPRWLDREIFSSADVPYRLADHDRLIADPRRSITFDQPAHDACMTRVAACGPDGRLVHDAAGVVLSGLGEKLLIPVLAKVCSLVPDGGIWMNTQRPEWNDANNALAGFGLSMVTACQLRRHLTVLRGIFIGRAEDLRFSTATAGWLEATTGVLETERGLLEADRIDDHARRRVMDALGRAFERRRHEAFGRPAVEVSVEGILSFIDHALAWIDHAIAANRRRDGLHHGYNLLQLGEGTASIRRLPEMLEGQVAVLSSGILGPEEAADLVERLFASALHREDLDTFVLQPARRIPSLLEKGVIPVDRLDDLPLLRELADQGDRRLVERDGDGTIRFAGNLTNGRDLDQVLDDLAAETIWADRVAAQRAGVLEAYESIFDHHAFTGRSGGMYGYEGIGCTYWHMVAKLLVAVGVCARAARSAGAAPTTNRRLVEGYRRVRDGLGFRMDAATFGALPIDAYSHSNGDGQARQPGMTGQVKEELLTRRMELGVQAV
ncbi:MAG: hypothetical protein VX672_05600, partial [Planctomycetota bacterium]|nr:hypothetical protein [Planctomycetota bacterium]